MTDGVTFHPDEVKVIKETLERLGPLVSSEKGRSWPFAEHHDIVARRLRRRTKGRLSRGQMAALLAQWARQQGDISLYVLQAIDVASGEACSPALAGELSMLGKHRPSFSEFLAEKAEGDELRS
jgi:hypothetical protein